MIADSKHKSKLSEYTIAANCSDIDDCNAGLKEVEDAIRNYKGTRAPLYYYTRKRKLIVKRDKLSLKKYGMTYNCLQAIETKLAK